MVSRRKVSFDWMPDRPDIRDFYYAAKRRSNKQLPQQVSLANLCSKVENQGQVGSCTGNAIVGALEYLLRSGKSGDAIPTATDLSRLFVYYNERLIEGTVGKDDGAYIRDGIKSLQRWGICDEKTWPYRVKNVLTKPTDVAYKQAQTRINKLFNTYMRVDHTQSAILNTLADGYPIVFGFTVYPEFMSDDVAKSGILPMPDGTQKPLGGHAVLMVGYDMATRCVLVRNSWGTKWGQNGYFWMPFDYVFHGDLAEDFWVVTYKQ